MSTHGSWRLENRPVIILLIAAVILLTAGQGLPGSAAEPGNTQGPPSVRFEGYLKAQGAGKWVVGDFNVIVDQQTTVIEKRGRAEVGAWLIVWANSDVAGGLYAELIYVDRPAGQNGPIVQISGRLTKKQTPFWVVNNILILITSETYIPVEPREHWIVWVMAERRGTDLHALTVEVIAQTPGDLPVEFEGKLEEIGTPYWQVSGRPVEVISQTLIIGGPPAVGQDLEIKGTLPANGIPVAGIIRIVPSGGEVSLGALVAAIGPDTGSGQEWSMIVFPDEPWANPFATLMYVNGNTLVDERRAAARPGQWAEVTALPLGGDEYQADRIRLEQPVPITGSASESQTATISSTPWSQPMPVVTGLTSAANPVLAFTRHDGTAHAVWESAGALYYAFRQPDGRWSTAEWVAMGVSPALVAASSGTLHLVFANQFMGNHEIYHVSRAPGGAWSLPVNVSHTTGYSAEPALAVTSDGALYATWMDNTPGYWTIYFGAWYDYIWSSEPVPNGRGAIPALAAARNGTLYLAWQDHLPTTDILDIFLSERVGQGWSVPINISDQPTADSNGVSITTTSDGLAHVTWVDGGNQVRYSFGHGNLWSVPQTVSRAAIANAPRILAENSGWLTIAWDEGQIIRATAAPAGGSSWPKPEVITLSVASVKDVALAAIPAGGVALEWTQTSSGSVSIYTAWRNSTFRWRRWLPLSVH